MTPKNQAEDAAREATKAAWEYTAKRTYAVLKGEKIDSPTVDAFLAGFAFRDAQVKELVEALEQVKSDLEDEFTFVNFGCLDQLIKNFRGAK